MNSSLIPFSRNSYCNEVGVYHFHAGFYSFNIDIDAHR